MSLLTRTALTCLVAVIPALLASSPAEAGHYYRPHARTLIIYPKGLYVGGGLIGTRILHQQGGDELLDHGGGLAFHVGWRLHRVLALEAGWMGTVHRPDNAGSVFGDSSDTLVLNGLTADAKVYFETTSEDLEPFLQGGVGLYLLDSSYVGTQSVGTGFQAGGGFDIGLAERLNAGVRVLYRGMAMGPPDTSTAETFVSAVTAEANLSFRF